MVLNVDFLLSRHTFEALVHSTKGRAVIANRKWLMITSGEFFELFDFLDLGLKNLSFPVQNSRNSRTQEKLRLKTQVADTLLQ